MLADSGRDMIIKSHHVTRWNNYQSSLKETNPSSSSSSTSSPPLPQQQLIGGGDWVKKSKSRWSSNILHKHFSNHRHTLMLIYGCAVCSSLERGLKKTPQGLFLSEKTGSSLTYPKKRDRKCRCFCAPKTKWLNEANCTGQIIDWFYNNKYRK